MSKSKWKQLLNESGFAEVVILPHGEEIPAILSHEAVIVARTNSNQLKQVADNKVVLNKQQQNYLDKFITTHTKKTQKSKQIAQTSRPVLADKRATAGFRMELKEIKYPIVAESSNGSRIYDIDGNKYIDISMGFGVHLFGHQPQFITDALQNQLKQGMQIGPQAKLAIEVARLVSELTGMERVAFCNSGTEAVMSGLRLARLATKRIFSGAYHGQFDGVLAVPSTDSFDENFKAAPMFPGVLQTMVDDVLVLSYGTEKSLETIKAHAGELAAVIVEPVQSRRPDLQPKEFLQQLRQFTQETGIALIFDEVVTGFRIHPRGAQAWFGIEADIVTYGSTRLHFSLDDLIADAWSMMLLLQQWQQLYENPEIVLPKLEISFRDYVLSEVSLKDTAEYQQAKEYWFNPNLPPAPEIPFALHPSSISKPKFSTKLVI